MTHTATISSKGQVTIPIQARRKFGLTRKVVFEIRDNELILKAEPSFDEIRALLQKSPTPHKLSAKEQALSDHYTAKHKEKFAR